VPVDLDADGRSSGKTRGVAIQLGLVLKNLEVLGNLELLLRGVASTAGSLGRCRGGEKSEEESLELHLDERVWLETTDDGSGVINCESVPF
jgi:hypothetical protein